MNTYLSATFAALACGPVLYAVSRTRPRLRLGFGVLVWVAVLALLLTEVIPEALHVGGLIGGLWFLLGLLGPTALEHALRGLRRETHLATLAVALAGLALHALADGAVIASDHEGELSLAIALHTLPIGLAICWLTIPVFGWTRALLLLGAVGFSTLIGYLVMPDLQDRVQPEAWAWVQMTVSGLLLHALLGRPHAHASADAH